MKRSITRAVVYAHPPERVWRALTDSELLAQWFMPNDFVPAVGHEFSFRTDPAPGFDGIVHCQVVEVEAPRRLAYTWRGGPIDTMVSFTLEPVGDGTRLRFEQTGFEGLKAVLVSYILGGGFAKFYRQLLPAVLERLASNEADPHVPSAAEKHKPSAAVTAFAKVIDKLPD